MDDLFGTEVIIKDVEQCYALRPITHIRPDLQACVIGIVPRVPRRQMKIERYVVQPMGMSGKYDPALSFYCFDATPRVVLVTPWFDCVTDPESQTMVLWSVITI